jgi:hypothetical protein
MRPAILLVLPALLSLAACASTAPPGAMVDPAVDPTAALEDPQVVRRVAPNGDVIEEYRVAGQLRVVKVTPVRGPTYYLIDDNGDGRPDDRELPMTHWKLFEWN